MEKLSNMAEGSGSGRRRVDYFYDSTLGLFNYGEGHPMRPHRVRLTHELVVNYNLYKHRTQHEDEQRTQSDSTLESGPRPARHGAQKRVR